MKPLQLIMIVTLCSLMCTGLDTEIVVKRHKHKKESLTRVSHFPYDLIPKGCYGQKQMRELFFGARRENLYKHKPITPDWCTETDYVIPKHLKVRKSETTAPPYHLHVNRFQQSKNIFQVILKSELSSTIRDAVLVARPYDSGKGVGTTNIGRFLSSHGVSLICCSLTDKDVALYSNNNGFIDEVVFYWTPFEEIAEDYEGQFVIIATVAKSKKEYWVNITSQPTEVVPVESFIFNV